MAEERLLGKDMLPSEMGCRSEDPVWPGSVEVEQENTWTALLSGELLLGERGSAMRS